MVVDVTVCGCLMAVDALGRQPERRVQAQTGLSRPAPFSVALCFPSCPVRGYIAPYSLERGAAADCVDDKRLSRPGPGWKFLMVALLLKVMTQRLAGLKLRCCKIPLRYVVKFIGGISIEGVSSACNGDNADDSLV
ncbi:hypothetical protein BHE74_00012265 [Ensete ventricosum]|nr:hypothetical protein GW17_00011974 [Ensete ventricosum]RWW79447.1 hypothetical protein BHE74_00012265 [Ensete ventricosum]RZS03698.1 hypothetical protein BHM03_00033910 [Ensete ventricosum]